MIQSDSSQNCFEFLAALATWPERKPGRRWKRGAELFVLKGNKARTIEDNYNLKECNPKHNEKSPKSTEISGLSKT